MIEETFDLTIDGKDYHWEIIHNLDEFEWDLDDFVSLYEKNFPGRNDLTEFCMFVVLNGNAMLKNKDHLKGELIDFSKLEHFEIKGGKRNEKYPGVFCFPKAHVENMMAEKNN